jgi:hypothetical protein
VAAGTEEGAEGVVAAVKILARWAGVGIATNATGVASPATGPQLPQQATQEG